MGEYITINKQQTKLGTCEDLYYTRLEQLLKDIRHIHGVNEYLNPDNGFRYRFPFPEEDGIEIGCYRDFDKSIIISLKPEDYDLLDFEHSQIWNSCHPAYGGYNVNISMPCPQSKDKDWLFIQKPDNELKRINYSPITWRIVGIKQQKQVNDEIWTVISCPYCGVSVRLEYEAAHKLAHSIKAGYIDSTNDERQKEYYQKVHDRILQGYKLPVS